MKGYLSKSCCCLLTIGSIISSLAETQSSAFKKENFAANASAKDICQSPKIARILFKKFHYKMKHHLHSVAPQNILSLQNIQLTKYEAPMPNGIARWYCEADSILDNKAKHKIYYMIEKSKPFTALDTTNIEFCLESFAPSRIHNGFCRSIRSHSLGAKFKRQKKEA